jgi:hypothetical protein
MVEEFRGPMIDLPQDYPLGLINRSGGQDRGHSPSVSAPNVAPVPRRGGPVVHI